MSSSLQPQFPDRGQPSPQEASGLPLVEEFSPSLDVFESLAALADVSGVLLLESARKLPHIGRFSFLTADPFRVLQRSGISYGDDPIHEVRQELQRWAMAGVPELPPFQGGAAGLLGYEFGHAWEDFPLPNWNEFGVPDLAVGFYDWVLAWDHEQDRVWLVSHGYPETVPSKRTTRAADRIAWVRAKLSEGPKSQPSFGIAPSMLGLAELAPQYPVPRLDGLTSNFTRDAYLRAVERVIEYIFAGDIFQANLSQRLLYPARLSPLELYERLRVRNAAPFAGYFCMDDWAIASASPERFVQCQAGEVQTRPIKGTRRRSRHAEADLFTRDELRESEKDQAENVMIVDLLRNDLSRVCRPGTLRVPQLCEVETYETVQHLVSEIRATLRDGIDVWDVFAAACPGGSITGAPKVRAMQIISELENTVRGPYCGSLFYAGFDGRADSNLLIRTCTVRHGWIQCPVGGGIVAQSDPVAEYLETLYKAEGVLRAFG